MQKDNICQSCPAFYKCERPDTYLVPQTGGAET